MILDHYPHYLLLDPFLQSSCCKLVLLVYCSLLRLLLLDKALPLLLLLMQGLLHILYPGSLCFPAKAASF